VIEFEPSRLGAAVAAIVDETASAPVAFVDGALDRGGNVPRVCIRRGCLCPRSGHDAEALLLHLRHEQRERRAEDAREVAIRDPMTQQVLRLPDLVAEFS